MKKLIKGFMKGLTLTTQYYTGIVRGARKLRAKYLT